MSDFLHIHLPCTDADIEAIEKALGIKFQRVEPQMIPAEKVEVCPMTPTDTVDFMELRQS